MDRNKRDLEALVASQKEQLMRYEKRLKDVVTAYKGLLKEKEALETSLAAITTSNSKDKESTTQADNSTKQPTSYSATNATTEDKNRLQTQIITLMNSLATLSAEKSRMEASFQADKKQLRSQMMHKDQTIADLHLQIKETKEQAQNALEEMKAKWIAERQEREQETSNQMLMIRELQKLYADERHLKENIEMQLNDFKTQFVSEEAESRRIRELQAQLTDAQEQLKILQQTTKKQDDGECGAASAVLFERVQQEMQLLKDQHAAAIKSEQKRALLAEERSKDLASAHEERVANLEGRLAELSATVGTYDRLRQQDQKSIQELKQRLQDIDRRKTNASDEAKEKQSIGNLNVIRSDEDIKKIVEEIKRLKKLLIIENQHKKTPIDINKVFSSGEDYARCEGELHLLQEKYEIAKSEILQLREKVQVQKEHITTLQDKIKVLNRNIDEQELELKQQSKRQLQAVMDERSKWKDALIAMENECRCKINDIEQQLQKQRQRSLQLLDEKEQEIKALQTSFEVFHAANMPTAPGILNNATDSPFIPSSDGESIEGDLSTAARQKLCVKSKKMAVSENCHMLHYANEIARKDIEITGLRKAKYAAENSLRKAIHDKVSVQQELNDRIAELDEQIDRLERCKTREGANLEYLKNVIISYIVTKDADGKQHMLNAIGAVLQFTPSELQAITTAFPKK